MRFVVTLALVGILSSPVSYARDEVKTTDGAKECSPRMAALQNGRRTFRAEAEHYTLDANTLSDLKVVERLYPGLDKTRTIFGAERLESLIKNPYMSEDEITLRQNAVTELINNQELRASVAEFLNFIKSSVQERFQHHFYTYEKPVNQDGTALVGALVSACAAVACVAIPQGWKFLPALIYPKAFIHAPLEGPLSNLRWDLNLYKNVLTSAERQIDPLSLSHSTALQEIGAVFSAIREADHPESVASMMPTYREMLPYGKLSQTLDFLYGHSNWSLKKAQRQLLENKEKLVLILSAIAELDTYLALAETALASPDFTAPQILRQDKPQMTIVDGHNPFLYFKNREKSVPNSFDSSANFTILTGSNAGGKSTYLKMIGLVSIMAQIGSYVPAKAFVFTPVEQITNIDNSDSLEDGKSFYRAESHRLKEITDKMAVQPKLLVIMDEILLGTNPKDRHRIEKSVVRFFTASGRLSLLATHDIEITKIANVMPGIQNLTVDEERDADGTFRFTFKIIPGVTRTSTAYEILRAEGVPAEIVDPAEQEKIKETGF